jgi:hypothetical protein
MKRAAAASEATTVELTVLREQWCVARAPPGVGFSWARDRARDREVLAQHLDDEKRRAEQQHAAEAEAAAGLEVRTCSFVNG